MHCLVPTTKNYSPQNVSSAEEPVLEVQEIEVVNIWGCKSCDEKNNDGGNSCTYLLGAMHAKCYRLYQFYSSSDLAARALLPPPFYNGETKAARVTRPLNIRAAIQNTSTVCQALNLHFSHSGIWFLCRVSLEKVLCWDQITTKQGVPTSIGFRPRKLPSLETEHSLRFVFGGAKEERNTDSRLSQLRCGTLGKSLKPSSTIVLCCCFFILVLLGVF